MAPRDVLRILIPTFAIVAGASCGDGAGDVDEGSGRRALFMDVTARSGVDFRHEVAMRGDYALPEIMGSGCAVFDADGDGDLDLYFLNAGSGPDDGAENRLYVREDDGRYRDATAESGLGDRGYGMGVAVGDLDGNGHLDVYVGNWGRDALYLGRGGGRFENATESAGLVREDWTTSVALVDYDLDGRLDVFVVHYLVPDPSVRCGDAKGVRDYCSPASYPSPRSDALLRNLGGARFEDVSEKVGLDAQSSYGLGVVVDDFNGDGRPDVYVANDGQPNHLWINEPDGRFVEDALQSGVAVNGDGRAEASMGVTMGDVDGDGREDLFMTHLSRESHTLYRRTGPAGFNDDTNRARLVMPSRPKTGFGTCLADLDHDGDLDLVVANGRVTRGAGRSGGPLGPYAEANQLLLNEGGGTFADVSKSEGDLCGVSEVSRGLALADLDDDGDLDLVVTNCGGPARIYENQGADGGGWISIRVLDAEGASPVIGARVEVHTKTRVLVRVVRSSESYLSSWVTPLHFGLGDAGEVERIVVHWPGGARETFSGGRSGRGMTLIRGQGGG